MVNDTYFKRPLDSSALENVARTARAQNWRFVSTNTQKPACMSRAHLSRDHFFSRPYNDRNNVRPSVGYQIFARAFKGENTTVLRKKERRRKIKKTRLSNETNDSCITRRVPEAITSVAIVHVGISSRSKPWRTGSHGRHFGAFHWQTNFSTIYASFFVFVFFFSFR